MPEMPLVGRDAELAQVDELLAAAVAGSGAAGLVVRGPRGIGMTALLDAAAERAREQGVGVVRAAGVEAEAGFPYAGLHQLTRPLRRAIPGLAPAQRDALGAAFGEPDQTPDRFAVGLGALALLTGAADGAPLLVCVDEAQWLDPESLATIAFVARRLERQPIALIAGAHATGPLADLGLPELALPPLPGAAAAAVLDAVAPALDPFTRDRILTHAQGRPLALTELPAAVAGADEGALLGPWPPLTPALADTFARGVEALPRPTRVLLAAAAADPGADLRETLAAGAAMARAALSAGDLQPAVDAGLVALEGERLRFAHPLTCAGAYLRAGEADRRRLHHAWAGVAVVRDPDRATWHRAVAALEADEHLAGELAAVAVRRHRDGETVPALAAARGAARLTPAGPDRDARLVVAADLAVQAGALSVGDRLLADVVPERLDPLARARLAAMTGTHGPVREDAARTRTLAQHARHAAAAKDRDLALRLLGQAAGALEPTGPGGDGELLVATARDVADAPAAPGLLAVLATIAPREHEEELLAAIRAAEAAAPAEDPRAALLLGHAAFRVGDPHAAAGLLARATDGLRAATRLTDLGPAVALSAYAAAQVGALDRAAGEALEAERLCGRLRLPVWRALAEGVSGLVAALRGDEQAAEERAAAAERLALGARASAVLALVQHVRGVSALGAGRPAEAYAHLVRVHDPLDPACDPASAAALIGVLAEAAADADQRATVAALLDGLPPSRAPRLAVAAAAARVTLAEDDEADAAFAKARAAGAERWPLEDARMLLAHGMRLRRLRRVAESRAPLRAAQERFAALGAAPWAERAARELAATSETANRSTGAGDRLTPQELQIARMAARGMTNRQIADQLALSPRTVGAHLAHVFPKLGVTGRGAIAAALDADPADAADETAA